MIFKTRGAYTLLELIIASAITVTLVASVLTAWTSTTKFSYMIDHDVDVAESISLIQNTLKQDCTNSALFETFDSVLNNGTRIYPYPIVTNSSRTLEFIRLRSKLNADIANEYGTFENLPATNAVPLSAVSTCAISPFTILNPAQSAGQSGLWNISPVWESERSGLTFIENADPANLRHYRYILYPYKTSAPGYDDVAVTFPAYSPSLPTLLRGTLVRQYRNSTDTIWTTIFPVLSDSIVFGTMTPTGTITFAFETSNDPTNINRGNDMIQRDGIRLIMTIAQQISLNDPPKLINLRIFYPLSATNHG